MRGAKREGEMIMLTELRVRDVNVSDKQGRKDSIYRRIDRQIDK